MSVLRISAAFLCAACAAPRAADTTIAASAESIDQRSPTAELVASALELADLDALSLAPPTAKECADPSLDGYWYGAAYAFAPAVREARALALAALAREEAAGAPGPVGLRLVDHEAGGDDTLIEAVATLDLLRLLGVGPASAEIALARATSLRALATLGSALWEAPFAVDRARIDLEAAQLRARLQAELSNEAGSDLDRVAILEERGRLGAAPAAVARGQAQATRGAFEAARGSAARARAGLALAAGLVPEAVANTPEWDMLDRGSRSPAAIDPDHPALRAARLDLAVAEARLRSVAARAWPDLRLGPHLGFPAGGLDPLRLGGVFTAMAPVPSSYEGLMEAAAVERDRALERYAEAVLALRIGLDAAGTRLEAAERRVAAASSAERATAQAWDAARSVFRAGGPLAPWINAHERRRMAMEAHVAARAERARAELEARRVAGPRPGGSESGALALEVQQ